MKRSHTNNINIDFEIESISKSLQIEGFVVIKQVFDIPTDVYNEIVSQINTQSTPHRNDNEKSADDSKRHRTNLSTDTSCVQIFDDNTTVVLNSIINKINPVLKVYPWYIYKSFSGCQHQLAHCDFFQHKDFLKYYDDNAVLSVILALERGTKLHVWPKSINSIDPTKTKPSHIKRSTINMNGGDVIIFRGDLIHAGAGYFRDNYRMLRTAMTDEVFNDKKLWSQYIKWGWLDMTNADPATKKRIVY